MFFINTDMYNYYIMRNMSFQTCHFKLCREFSVYKMNKAQTLRFGL